MKPREWPLVLFTLTGQTAAGLAIFLLLPVYFPVTRSVDPRFAPLRAGAALGVLLLAVAAAVLSLAHLGRTARAPRSVANIATSWLSREIAVLVVFIAAAAALVVGESRGFGAAFRSALAFLAAGSGGALVFSMSRIYRLPTVPDWDSASTPAAFISSASVLGSALASIVVRTWNPALETNLPRATLYVLAAAFAVALLFAPRFGLLARRRPSPAFRPDPKAPAVFAVRMMLFALAIFFWAVSMIKPEAAGVTRWASMAFLFESEVFGRMLFYTIPADL